MAIADVEISEQEFMLFRQLIYKIAGINLTEAKKVLLVGRLQRRLRHYKFQSYMQYYRFVTSPENAAELQVMVDALTTNETYFFREVAHFDFLRQEILPQRNMQMPFRIWSAASSTGEEAYTLAMILAETIMPPQTWEIVGSDISTQVLAKAQLGHYPLARNEGIPREYLIKYCLKGKGPQDGTFLVKPELRKNVRFCQVNLTLPVSSQIGAFDVIFLRNVMIYFDHEVKQKVVNNLIPQLKQGGYLIIGHSESLHGLSTPSLKLLRPTIFRKVFS